MMGTVSRRRVAKAHSGVLSWRTSRVTAQTAHPPAQPAEHQGHQQEATLREQHHGGGLLPADAEKRQHKDVGQKTATRHPHEEAEKHEGAQQYHDEQGKQREQRAGRCILR